MFDPAQLAALAAVHRRGSFDLAAAALNVTPSAISQRIKALEDRMGTLLIRRGQPCTATGPGLRLIRHHDEVALLETQLSRDLALAPAQMPTLRVAVNADSLATWVLPALARVPDTLFDLVIDDQDHSQEWLRRGEVAAAITGHPGPLQGCETQPLGTLRYLATASPRFMARWFSGGVTRAALSQAPALTFSDKDRLQRDWVMRLTGTRFAYPTHRIASSTGFVDAACLGIGWGMNPEPLIADHLISGALEALVADTALDVPLYWQFARLTAPALTPLTKALLETAKNWLRPL